MINRDETAYVLASSSPRRKQLLAYLQLPQTYQFVVDTDETIATTWTPQEAVKRLSLNKALAVFDKLSLMDDTWSTQTKLVAVIAADTIVVRDDQILGKPKDAAEAFAMLKSLQGRSHDVFTGLTLLSCTDAAVMRKEEFATHHLVERLYDTTPPMLNNDEAFGQIGYFTQIEDLQTDNLKLCVGYVKSKVTFRPLTDSQITNYINTGDPLDKAGAYGIQGIGAVNIEAIDGDFYSVMGLPLSLLHHFISLANQ